MKNPTTKEQKIMDEILKSRARTMRSNATEAEQYLWQHLRKAQLKGNKFRRQHVIGNYIADFVCIPQKLVIELDGSQHMENHQYDDKRTKWLMDEGYRVLRFWNNQIFNEMDGVLELIMKALETPPSQPSPSNGEGRRKER